MAHNEEKVLERIGGANELFANPDHLARYRFAMQWAPASHVLDLGCGVGYGSRILASGGARQVYGVDVSREAIEMARRQGDIENLSFVLSNGAELPPTLSGFDLITCFEVVEHVDKPDRILAEIRDRLRPDGIAVISTPNSDAYPGGHSGNPFHPSEMSAAAFQQLAGRFFEHIDWYAQFDNDAIWKRPSWQRALIRALGLRRKPSVRPAEARTSAPLTRRINVGIDDWYPVRWEIANERMYAPPPPLVLAVCQQPKR